MPSNTRWRYEQTNEALASKWNICRFYRTPLLQKDRKTTREIFGTYIHTYKFHEGVEDGVVLDLKYEARMFHRSLLNQKLLKIILRAKPKC